MEQQNQLNYHRGPGARPAVFADLLLVLTTLLWGGGFIVVKMAVDLGLPPFLILASRFLIAVAVLSVIFIREFPKAHRNDFLFGIGAGLLLFSAFSAQTFGMKFTTPSNNAFLTSTNVVMVPFISWLLFRQRPQPRSVVLAFSCFFGAMVLAFVPGAGLSLNSGDLLTLLCAFLFALHIAYLGATAPRIRSASVLNIVQLGTAGILSALFFLIFDPWVIDLTAFRAGAFAILYLGVFSTGVCFFFQTYAQRFVPPTRAAIILSCEGLCGSILSVLFGYDRVTPQLLCGGIIIVSSVLLTEIHPLELLRKRLGKSPALEQAGLQAETKTPRGAPAGQGGPQ